MEDDIITPDFLDEQIMHAYINENNYLVLYQSLKIFGRVWGRHLNSHVFTSFIAPGYEILYIDFLFIIKQI
jgi:hypothetical protein